MGPVSAIAVSGKNMLTIAKVSAIRKRLIENVMILS
jgi:hypothetical protein